MEDIKKFHNNINAYKGVGNIIVLCSLIGGISLFACLFFIALTVRIDLLFLIGVVTTGVFGLWSIGIHIKREAYPKLVLKQQDDSLYLFPDTKKQIVLSLSDIVELRKKKSSYLAWGRGTAGQLIIISKTNNYTLNIRDVNTIYTILNENLNLFNKTT